MCADAHGVFRDAHGADRRRLRRARALARHSLLALVVCSTFVLLPSRALAQTDTATISGRISDPSGQVVDGVRVTATNTDTGVDLAAESNADGIYVVRNLRPGRYRMVVEKDGFRTIVLDRLTVAVGDALGRNFTMEIGTVNDSVTVTAGHQELNLSPAVSTVVNRQLVEHMPLNGRSFQSLIQLTPGIVVTPSGQGFEGQFATNGQRTNANYFTVDGITVNFGTTLSVNLGQNIGGTLPALTVGGGTNSFVSVDAMEEFRTQTSTYAPEFGRSPGAQIAIVTRSGTNDYHGTAYDYVRHEAFDARNWFNPPPEPQPEMRQQDFGGTMGGPVRRNRTFFFFSYEGLRLRQPQTLTGTFYTPETRAAVAPVFRPFVDALPIPTGPVIAACDNVSRPCAARLTMSSSNPTSFDASSLRVDHTAGRRVALFGRVAHTPSVSRLRSFSSVESSNLDTDLVTAGLTVVFNSSLFNDLRAGWSRARGEVGTSMDDFGGAVPVPDSAIFPQGDSRARSQAGITLPGGSTVGGGTRAANMSDQFNIVDTLSFVRGAHQLRFGFDYRHLRPTNQGTNSFSVIVGDFGQLRAGTMDAVLVLASEPMTATLDNWSMFAQDAWRASDRLTVIYGLRWEINTPPVSVTPDKPLYAIDGVFDPGPLQLAPPGTPLWRTRYNNLAPRAGAAYALTRSTILRGGGGVFYDLGYGKLLGSVMFGFPYNRNRTTVVTGQAFSLENPALQPPPISTSLATVTLGNIAAFDPDLRLPQTFQWNASVEQQLGTHQSLTLTYVGANGRRLLRPDFVTPPMKPAGAPAVSATRNAGRSDYDALQVQFEQRLTRGLQALASYTLANARDTESDDGGGNFFGAALNADSAASVDQIRLPPLSPSDFDIRHSFSAAISYEIPAPDWGRVANSILRDWAVDGIVRIASAPPVNVRIQGLSPQPDAFNTQPGAYNTQPDLVPGQPIWLSAPDQPGGKILNPDAFTLPAPGVAGNFPRNSIRGPFGIDQTDLALRRRFALAGNVSLEFRAEFFNVFNHPMFGEPGEFWGRCTSLPCTGKQNFVFGRVLTTLNESLGGGGLQGGQSAIYAIGGPRSGQFSLKLRF